MKFILIIRAAERKLINGGDDHFSKFVFHKNCNSSTIWHRVKSVRIRSFFWSVFSGVRSDYRDLQSKVRKQ